MCIPLRRFSGDPLGDDLLIKFIREGSWKHPPASTSQNKQTAAGLQAEQGKGKLSFLCSAHSSFRDYS